MTATATSNTHALQLRTNRPQCLPKSQTSSNSSRSAGEKTLPVIFFTPLLHSAQPLPKKCPFIPHSTSHIHQYTNNRPFKAPTSANYQPPRTAARIKKNKKSSQIKFKVRCHRYLYTLVLKDADKADKLKQSLPPGKLHHLQSPEATNTSHVCRYFPRQISR